MSELPSTQLSFADVFPNSETPGAFLDMPRWTHPITYFVGRNGTGKSRAARALASRVSNARILSTDRLTGLMTFSNYGWTSVPRMDQFKGVPLGDDERTTASSLSQAEGSGIGEMFALKDQPEVWLRVAAFLRRALGRTVELREVSGYLDPYVRVAGVEYSLLRDEGHGLRELVLLLTAAYREDWDVLVVDEPELHLHPSMTRLWLSELQGACRAREAHAIVVTHEPALVRPTTAEDLGALWYFALSQQTSAVSQHVRPADAQRVTASLRENPQLVSQLVFSPRPVLVEGIHDVAALTEALARTEPAEVVAQTDLVECGGSGGVALWFEIARSMGLDVRAVADLDACLAPEVHRVMDASEDVARAYRLELAAEPPTTATVIRPLLDAMNKAGIGTNPKDRARWLAKDLPEGTGWEARLSKLLRIWNEAGFWLHSSGTLEDVLGIEQKGRAEAQAAARLPGAIDRVAEWVAYSLDPSGEVEALLGAAVERIAHGIMEALRLDPESAFSAPVGPTAKSDSRMVDVRAIGQGRHRITVKKPEQFAGHWVDFSRSTPSSAIFLRPPDEATDNELAG